MQTPGWKLMGSEQRPADILEKTRVQVGKRGGALCERFNRRPRSPPGPPGTAGPRSACSPARSSPWPPASAPRTAAPRILELIPVTVPELLRQLRGIVIPEPRRDKQHRDHWALWRRRHLYDAQQARQRWHAYADEVPR